MSTFDSLSNAEASWPRQVRSLGSPPPETKRCIGAQQKDSDGGGRMFSRAFFAGKTRDLFRPSLSSKQIPGSYPKNRLCLAVFPVGVLGKCEALAGFGSAHDMPADVALAAAGWQRTKPADTSSDASAWLCCPSAAARGTLEPDSPRVCHGVRGALDIRALQQGVVESPTQVKGWWGVDGACSNSCTLRRERATTACAP